MRELYLNLIEKVKNIEEFPMDIDKIISKALYHGEFKTKKALAEWLKIDPSAISQWKRAGNIPSHHLNLLEQLGDGVPSWMLNNNKRESMFDADSFIREFEEYQKSLHVNTSYISPKMDDMIRMFAILDRADQKRIFEEIKKLSDEKLDLSHLNEE